jgi:hypothetical protein
VRWKLVAAGEYESVGGHWRAMKIHDYSWSLYEWGGVGWLTYRTQFRTLKEAKTAAHEEEQEREECDENRS